MISGGYKAMPEMKGDTVTSRMYVYASKIEP
jgi:hypothetical protein